ARSVRRGCRRDLVDKPAGKSVAIHPAACCAGGTRIPTNALPTTQEEQCEEPRSLSKRTSSAVRGVRRLLRSTLHLDIPAHVDAGKTTLSERLLYEAGVIGEIGRVDDGTTQTDSLALERQRGITIRAAVVSLAINGVSVNLIDTPG